MTSGRIQAAKLKRWIAGAIELKPEMGVADRLLTSFQDAERSGLMLASAVRAIIATALIFVFLVTSSFVGEGGWFLVAMPFGIGLIGLIQFDCLRRFPNASWAKYVFIALDCAYLAGFLILRNVLSDDLPPVALAVKEGAILFFAAYLVHGAFSYSPKFILWTGLCITVAWGAVVWASAVQPGVFFSLAPGADIWARYGDPHYLPIIKVVYDYVLLIFLTGGLAAAVWRSRQLILAAVVSERARANLARHFSPRVVEELSVRNSPFGEVRRQACAVLFADIRGFTTRCESMPPEEAMAFLREFHSRMEGVIFHHGGTLDKILGDGLLAVFGAPERSLSDAGNGLSCAFAIMKSIEQWNEERSARGDFAVHVGIGLHFGHVMLGDVGSERLMTFTVVGDTVNVASRLQSLSKELGTKLVASEALVAAVRDEMQAEAQLVAELNLVGPRQLRGRESETVVYALGEIAQVAGAPPTLSGAPS